MKANNQMLISAANPDRVIAGAIAFLLGIFLLIGVGFVHSEVIHNAAHDSRHALGFPCH
jgi:cobalt transporter subunit CbtB